MQRVLVMLLAAGWGLGFLVLGLWTWQRGPLLVKYLGAGRPAAALWAARAAATSLIGAAEALVTLFVVGNIWHRKDIVTSAFAAVATVAFALGGVAAIGLGLAGR